MGTLLKYAKGLALLVLLQRTLGECIYSNTTLNSEIAGEGRSIPLPGSCCMADVCGLECPQQVPPPARGKADRASDCVQPSKRRPWETCQL